MFKNSFDGVCRFLREEDGPTTVEYAVMVSLILGVCIVAITVLGAETNDTFDESSTAISGAFGN